VNLTVADHLATIRLDRAPMNAVNTQMQVELRPPPTSAESAFTQRLQAVDQ
jgi:hypothetical protein